jgi:methanol metabolism-related c-type cytochrome
MADVIRRRSRPALAALVSAAALGGLSLAAAAQQSAEPDWEDKPYTVVDGKVDFGTYNGYRRYEAYCLRCHGPDAAGSSYAPALADSLKTMSYEDFLNVVVYGRKNVSASQQSVMPAFGEALDVMENIDDIYSYLKARADGVVGRGRPERLPK